MPLSHEAIRHIQMTLKVRTMPYLGRCFDFEEKRFGLSYNKETGCIILACMDAHAPVAISWHFSNQHDSQLQEEYISAFWPP